MAEQLQLDPEQIKKHYDRLLSTNDSLLAVPITDDTYTNLTVKTDATSALTYSLQLESKLKGCLTADATNLTSLGAKFISADSDVSGKISKMLDE